MNLLKITIILINLSFLFSCAGYQYISSPVYTPLHEKKGELKANISVNNIQASYSISNNIEIFALYDKNKGSGFDIEHIGGKENSGQNDYGSTISDYSFGLVLF